MHTRKGRTGGASPKSNYGAFQTQQLKYTLLELELPRLLANWYRMPCVVVSQQRGARSISSVAPLHPPDLRWSGPHARGSLCHRLGLARTLSRLSPPAVGERDGRRLCARYDGSRRRSPSASSPRDRPPHSMCGVGRPSPYQVVLPVATRPASATRLAGVTAVLRCTEKPPHYLWRQHPPRDR